jgi:hypothetical protein
MATACMQGGWAQHGRPAAVRVCDPQPDAREGQAGPQRETEKPIVPEKFRKRDGGKGPQFKAMSEGAKDRRLT